MSWASEMSAVAVTTLLFAAAFGAAELWWRWRRPPVEHTRKFLHLACGVIALPLAWTVQSPITALVITVGFMVILLVTKRFGWLPCMHGVERSSHGAVLYPAAVFLTWWIAHLTAHPEFYFTALLVLAASDSAASLVGTAYGRRQFLVEDDHKSVEGSAAFFLVTFTIVHVSLATLTDLGPLACVLSSVYVAALVTCVELLSLSGADNLLIPVAVITILLKITGKDVDEMLLQVGLMAFDFSVVALLLRRRTGVRASGIIGLGLLVYGAHALIGLSWAYVLLMGVALYGLSGALGFRADGSYRVRLVFFATLSLTVWILLANYLAMEAHVAFVPFAVNAIAVLQLALEASHQGARRLRYRLAALLALAIGIWHHLLDDRAVWWFDVLGLYVGAIVLGAIGERLMAGHGSAVALIRRCALAAVPVGGLLLAVSWRIYA